MDRKSNKILIRYLGAYLVFSIIFSLFLYYFKNYHSKELKQALILFIQHPELELKTNIIGLWEKSENWLFCCFWIIVMLLVASITISLGYISWRRKLKRDYVKENLLQLSECLIQFQRGEFRKIPEYDNTSEEWMQLGERLKELGIYFADLKKHLKEEEDSTKALITNISHQLKTPLASLRMSYELITSENITKDEQYEFQIQGEKEIQKLETLINELVKLSRLETHMITIKPIYASIKDTISEAVSQIYMKALQKDITVCVEIDEDMKVLHDVKWTAEALANVLENAVKYSEEHTVVILRVTFLTKNVLIEIEDEGMGISKKELTKIYQRFYRGSNARKKVDDGAGVGLYLTRMILEQEGGTISAKQKSDIGTVFRITLPNF